VVRGYPRLLIAREPDLERRQRCDDDADNDVDAPGAPLFWKPRSQDDTISAKPAISRRSE
jgi:hypothetical protein